MVFILLAGGFGAVWCRMDEPRPIAETSEVVAPAGGVAVVADERPQADVALEARLAIRFLLDGNGVSLAGISRVHGRFKDRRAARAAYPGMLRCSLVDADGNVLAEDLLIEPDRTCGVVLGKAALESGFRRGPVMCQTRLPDAPGAVALLVSRITGGDDVLLGKLQITR